MRMTTNQKLVTNRKIIHNCIGLKYLGTEMILDIHPTNTTLTIVSVDDNRPLVIIMKKNNNRIALQNGITGVIIFT